MSAQDESVAPYPSYDWAGDEGWQQYRLNVVAPVGMDPAVAEEKIRRKYYNRYIAQSNTTQSAPSAEPSPSSFSAPPQFPTFDTASSSSTSSQSPHSSSSSSSSNTNSRPTSSSNHSSSTTNQNNFSTPPPSAGASPTNPLLPLLASALVPLQSIRVPVWIKSKILVMLPRVWLYSNILLLACTILFIITFGSNPLWYTRALIGATQLLLSSLVLSQTFEWTIESLNAIRMSGTHIHKYVKKSDRN